ncbi:MAG: tRNA lysidine(34) synthetase TilS [Azoarcus sp.]|jgi:tRNA(Ile)-lysidine synthase|nr:tRNA lysidine(34) synthetase TilS [Azoarcus sp.]
MSAGAKPSDAAVFDAVAAVLMAAGVGDGQRLCCALSGGVDSVVLLDALAALRERFGFDLSAAHVHHGLNPAADEWRAFCADFCRRLDLPLHVFHVEVARDDPHGLEAAARAARHAALASVDCDWLALGHQRDDQAETVLFRLLRGAGVRGAAAMAAVEPGDGGRAGRLRPLLELGREEIVAHAHARALQWVEDASNASLEFARNDLRHRILPAIEARFPAARVTLARAARHFRDASGLLDELAALDAVSCAGANAGEFRRDALFGLNPARQANLLRWEFSRRGAFAPSQARLNEALRQLRDAARPLRFPLGDYALCYRRGRVWLEKTIP